MGPAPEHVGPTNMECTNFLSIILFLSDGLFNSLDELFHVGRVRDEAGMKEFIKGVLAKHGKN